MLTKIEEARFKSMPFRLKRWILLFVIVLKEEKSVIGREFFAKVEVIGTHEQVLEGIELALGEIERLLNDRRVEQVFLDI